MNFRKLLQNRNCQYKSAFKNIVFFVTHITKSKMYLSQATLELIFKGSAFRFKRFHTFRKSNSLVRPPVVNSRIPKQQQQQHLSVSKILTLTITAGLILLPKTYLKQPTRACPIGFPYHQHVLRHLSQPKSCFLGCIMKSISKLVAAETLPEVFVLLRVTPKRCSQWLPPQRSHKKHRRK